LHFPVLSTTPGHKLSKQNHARAVSTENTYQTLSSALAYIGLAKEKQLKTQDPNELLVWAIAHWSPKLLSKQREILISDVNEV
jgi:glutamyl-Q tRNA(Asp) synthetase